MMSEKEYIEREAAKRAVDHAIELNDTEFDIVCDYIDRIPAADVAPVKHARNLAAQFDETICTNCGVHLGEVLRIVREDNGDDAVYYYQPKYCANCGAKFDGGEWVERSKRKE